MSLLFGHHKSKIKPEYTGLAIQTSNSAIPITIGMGRNRVAPNIVWQGDFKANKQYTKTGKGLGGKQLSGYTYSGSFVLALGWGPSAGILNTWKDQSKTAGYSSLGFTFINGSIPQAPWGFLTTNHASQALGYAGLILMCVPNLDLGSSNTLAQHSFENQWPLDNTAPGGKGDADPAQAVDLFLNSPVYGAISGYPLAADYLFSTGAATTTGDNAFQTYCKAMGFGMSPLFDSQEAGTDILLRWATIFNSDLAWTGYSLAFVCRSADSITANGVTYLPDNTLEFALTEANGDFIYSAGSEPVKLRRARRSGLPNYGSLEIKNRSNDYNTEPAPWTDQGLIDQFGPNPASSYTAHEICEPSIGVICAELYGASLCYTPNQFEFSTGPGFMAYVVGSKGSIQDPQFGVQNVRVIDMQEQADGSFSVLCEEYNATISSASNATAEPAAPNVINTEVAPAAVNTPLIFEPPSTLAGSQPQIWVAASGGPAGAFDPNWGGCYVWLSSDGTTYQQVGEIDSAARMGVLTAGLASYGGANPDITHTLAVDLTESNGSLVGVTAADAAAFVTLCAIRDGGGTIEFLSYRDATLTAPNKYNLAGQLYRGLYGSAAGAHSIGALFARLDQNIFKLNLPAQFIGKLTYIKLQSFNGFGGNAGGVQDLSTCTAYTYTPTGAGYGGGSGGVPTTPATPSAAAQAGFNLISWAANPASDNVVRYDVYRAAGLGAAFGSASLIGNAAGASYSDSTAAASAAYTYFVEAINAIGPSSPSAGANCTSAAAAAQPFGFSFGPKVPVASKPIAFFDAPLAWTAPSGLANSYGNIIASDTAVAGAPSAQTDFDIQSPPGTSIGTMRFAASALSATFIMGSSHSVPAGQATEIIAPANLNGITGAIAGTIKGTRP